MLGGLQFNSKTPLYDFHTRPEHGGKMVEFAGWDMPLSYDGKVGDNVAGGPGELMFCARVQVNVVVGGNGQRQSRTAKTCGERRGQRKVLLVQYCS